MRSQMRRFVMITCITAATALASHAAFADYGTPGPRTEEKRGMHRKPHRHDGERFLQRMAKELGLTDQQKAKAKALFEEGKAKHKPLFQAMRTERGKLHALVQSGNADEAAIRAQAAKVAAIQADLAVARGGEVKELLSILTPEQAAKLKELKEKRGDRFREFPGCGEKNS